jgi:hypothetical protein
MRLQRDFVTTRDIHNDIACINLQIRQADHRSVRCIFKIGFAELQREARAALDLIQINGKRANVCCRCLQHLPLCEVVICTLAMPVPSGPTTLPDDLPRTGNPGRLFSEAKTVQCKKSNYKYCRAAVFLKTIDPRF